MNNNQSILNTVFLGIIAVCLIWIVIEHSKPIYTPFGAGAVVNSKTGQIFVYDAEKGLITEEEYRRR